MLTNFFLNLTNLQIHCIDNGTMEYGMDWNSSSIALKDISSCFFFNWWNGFKCSWMCMENGMDLITKYSSFFKWKKKIKKNIHTLFGMDFDSRVQ